MKERKTSKAQIVTIVILTLLLIANTTYLFYDKIYQKEERKKPEEKKVVEEKVIKKTTRKLSVAEERLLLSQIDDYNAYLAGSYPIEDVEKLPNQEKLLFAYHMMEEKKQKEFMQSELKKWIDTYFGTDNNVVYESMNCFNKDGVLYTYNDSGRIYTLEGEHGHEGVYPYQSRSYLVEGSVENEEKYTVAVHTVYAPYCRGTCGPILNYYKNITDAKEEKNEIITREDEKELTENDYEKVKDKLEKTIFTFQKDSKGNYGLQSVKIENS